ncbi:coiled-coil-helix-coiled-coil-helix domain containing 3a isoform X4 [Gymnodraco acuticeps]|uniref:Coiled-coil-helix-coiled-coil-helix domain containing 3a isoform X4 n=1 Tax=Gymnodraco acuticeps TaxID=8218 RepID=A0A6P8UD42_GYMAC|nr:coiled-coil-helix-coiled-coil-helix domain containing 3a isoform X4 [Gymnodraco acuticeps]
MGANNSTRRVSFESDENENVSVVKGIRLSENVINRMREPEAPPKAQPKAPPKVLPAPSSPPSMTPTITPSPFIRPVPPIFDHITPLPPLPSLVEPVAPPPAPSTTETVAAPPPPPPPAKTPTEQSPVEPASPVPEPVVVPEVISIPPPAAAAPPVDEVALRKTITDELHKDMEQDRAKAEQELQAWVETEKARAAAHAQDDAQSQVQGEVSRILRVERAAAEGSIQQAVIRERIATEDERLRAQLFEIGLKAKQLGAREADLKKQDAFYREQVTRLEERSAQFYKVTTENYHKAADQVNAKFRRYETYPVCADLQGQILACYKENVGKTLNCSNIATLYLQCVNNTKQNKLRTGG